MLKNVVESTRKLRALVLRGENGKFHGSNIQLPSFGHCLAKKKKRASIVKCVHCRLVIMFFFSQLFM